MPRPRSEILDDVGRANLRLSELLSEREALRNHPLITREGVRVGNVIAEAKRIAIDDPWKFRTILVLEEDPAW